MSHKHHHDNGCCSHCSCGCQSNENSCGQNKCNCSCHEHKGHECEEMEMNFLELADKAWMELLKEKIKARITATSNDTLEQLASLISDANHNRWKEIFASKKCCSDYKSNLKDFFRKKYDCNNKDCK